MKRCDVYSLSRASILQQIKEGYLLWLSIAPDMFKDTRYAIRARIENKFLDLRELSYNAYFAEKEKPHHIARKETACAGETRTYDRDSTCSLDLPNCP